MINTVVRQIAFYEFERKVHTARREGELTSEQLGALWMSVQARASARRSVSDGYETFWTYIPHFIHSPFYVYAYAFGDCLVNSLYAVYQEAESGLPSKVFRHAQSGRHQASFRTAGAIRPRCVGSGLLERGCR
jgi:oligoendopeptidase F